MKLKVALVIPKNRSCDPRPRLRQDEDAFHTISFKHSAGVLVENEELDAKKGKSGTARFEARGPGERREDGPAGFSLPISIDDGRLTMADDVMVEFPGFSVDVFADGAEDTEGGEIVVGDAFRAEFLTGAMSKEIRSMS